MTAAETLPPPRPLTDQERADYTRLRAVTHSTFTELAHALMAIHAGKLYREDYASMEAFCEGEYGKSRQWAYQLIDAAKTSDTLSNFGLQIESPAQARQMKGAGQIVEKVSPALQQAFARVVQKTTLTQNPLTVQVNSVAEVIGQIDAAGVVEDPDTGEHLPVESLPPERLDAILRENVSTASYERTKRQEGHVQASYMNAKSNGRGGWTDWVLTYAQQSLTDTQELRLIVKRDSSGNATVQALVVDTESHQTIAYGDTATYLKKAVLNLAEEVRS